MNYAMGDTSSGPRVDCAELHPRFTLMDVNICCLFSPSLILLRRQGPGAISPGSLGHALAEVGPAAAYLDQRAVAAVLADVPQVRKPQPLVNVPRASGRCPSTHASNSSCGDVDVVAHTRTPTPYLPKKMKKKTD